MSGGPIDQTRRGRLAPPVTTSPAYALHAPHEMLGRAYCGRRKVPLGTPVSCSDCLAAIAADSEGAS